MPQKLIFVDIDGTLTAPGSNTPPDSALEAIQAARALGHKVYLCSGRNPDMLSPLLRYDFDGFIGSAGGYVVSDGKVLFGCGSWLLYPRMKEFLPSHMNILKFQSDFHIVAWAEKDDFHDAWRLYGRDAGKAPADLPRDTSFRRAYADWLLSGHKAGDGLGFFLFDGEKILH